MSSLTEVPKFQHDDPEHCVFLGHFEGHDLYFCPQSGLPTLIARASSEESDYLSGLVFADSNRHIGEAKVRAEKRGLL